jgi:hypothetical protein
VTMVSQAVRDVAEEEEPKSISAVIEVPWPRYEPDQPDGNNDDRGQPCVKGELETFELCLSNARPKANL